MAFIDWFGGVKLKKIGGVKWGECGLNKGDVRNLPLR